MGVVVTVVSVLVVVVLVVVVVPPMRVQDHGVRYSWDPNKIQKFGLLDDIQFSTKKNKARTK